MTCPWIDKGHILKLKPKRDRAGQVKSAGQRFHRRFHGEEREQIGQEESLVGHARSGREGSPDVAHRLHNGGAVIKCQVAHGVVSFNGSQDAEEHKPRSIQAGPGWKAGHPRTDGGAIQAHILVVDYLRKRSEPAGQIAGLKLEEL